MTIVSGGSNDPSLSIPVFYGSKPHPALAVVVNYLDLRPNPILVFHFDPSDQLSSWIVKSEFRTAAIFIKENGHGQNPRCLDVSAVYQRYVGSFRNDSLDGAKQR